MSIGLVEDVLDSLVNCKRSVSTIWGRGNATVVPEWMLSASLSGISMLNSSSMAMTTSTVSRLSRPRSLAK